MRIWLRASSYSASNVVNRLWPAVDSPPACLAAGLVEITLFSRERTTVAERVCLESWASERAAQLHRLVQGARGATGIAGSRESLAENSERPRLSFDIGQASVDGQRFGNWFEGS